MNRPRHRRSPNAGPFRGLVVSIAASAAGWFAVATIIILRITE